MMRRFLLATLLSVPILLGQSLDGLWDATVNVRGVEIPFRMEISGSGGDLKASFFNGDEKVTSTSGKFANGALVAAFAYYNSELKAEWNDGVLSGEYHRDDKTYKALKWD